MNLSQLISNYETIEIIGNPDIEISTIVNSSTQVSKKSVFVAIKGTIVDGHQFIESAQFNGASAIVCSILPSRINSSICYVLVKDTGDAFAYLSHTLFGNPSSKMQVIGVTGTNGKTTTTFLLKAILDYAEKSNAIIGTTGIYVNDEKRESTHTTPMANQLAELFNEFRESEVKHVAMEVSSHSLVQRRVAYIDFDIAMITNLSHDHLDYHKSMEQYAIAKKILFDELKGSGIALAFVADSYTKMILSGAKGRKYSVGYDNADFCIEEVVLNSQFTQFRIVGENLDILIKSPLIGKFNIENISLSVLAAYFSGIDINIIKNAISQSTGAAGRMERFVLKRDIVAVVDYAHTPDALEKALLACREICESRLHIVFGCGGDRDKAKRPIMGKLAKQIADVVIVTDDNPRTENAIEIANDILAGIENKENVDYIGDRKLAIHQAIANSGIGDIVLIAGKGHEDYQIIGNEKKHFSDVEVVKAFDSTNFA